MAEQKIISMKTERSVDFYDITAEIETYVKENDMQEGMVLIYTPHTTAGITINENADPSVRADIREFIKRKIPHQEYFTHAEGNSPAHIMCSLFSVSETIIVHEGRLILGTWQGIFFCEFDGPRLRKIIIKGIES